MSGTQKIVIQSAKNAKTAKNNKTEDKINHVSIFPFRKQTICIVTQHTGGGGGGRGQVAYIAKWGTRTLQLTTV